MVEHTGQFQRGTVEIESTQVPYLDLRAEPTEAARERLDQFIEEIGRTPDQHTSPLRGLAITTPQPSDQLGLSLTSHGIMLIVGGVADPLPALINRFRNQLRFIRSAQLAGGSQIATSQAALAGTPVRPMRQSRSESPFAQQPPWFDPAAFDEHPLKRNCPTLRSEIVPSLLAFRPLRDRVNWTHDVRA